MKEFGNSAGGRWMTDQQIARSYENAADPALQPRVIAELNCMRREEVCEILRRMGYNIRYPAAQNSMSVGGRRSWTPEELDRARQMRARGMSYKRIGIALGRSVSNVFERLGAADRMIAGN